MALGIQAVHDVRKHAQSMQDDGHKVSLGFLLE